MAIREWVLKRNCSLTPRQLAVAYSLLCAGSLIVAGYFLMHGVWYVLGFTFIELLAVGGAFLWFARHATDRECIALMDDCLLVELVETDQVRQVRLDPRSIRVEAPKIYGGLVRLEANGTRVDVGRFVAERRRREFAGELKRALAS